ncbi:Domain of uncharacterised function (DUF3560) [Chryseobacterium nakagawai]|uniref:DUF3560 domain-containing protein n=1 Tax=Chryseobacterium nakagawai TaxID=1241982 RepID=A0AAD0YQY1_CHRNA|nr:DUF3560 domain-containing protein [Chryseobacterium nakagawai]AZA93058.1 DUF3560 domain-containing protein [Chryseobacterium nakagawai]VEH19691.1 Domain of uncharacterised function (DUF3560) [Chryseobacterium nakagawai]
MNTYSKFGPNVFLAKCVERHAKGDVINVTTKYGKENESEIFNLMYEKDGFFFYSIIRVDGTNTRTRAEAKATKYNSWAASAEKKSAQYHEASNEGADFLRLAEPIKIGHHSEKRHRALIERNWNRMGRAIAMSEKAESHESKAEYWEKRAKDINLSMPESIEYYEYKLQAAKMEHEGMKNGTIQRRHSMALQYAKKAVNEAQKNFELAKKLWG